MVSLVSLVVVFLSLVVTESDLDLGFEFCCVEGGVGYTLEAILASGPSP